MWMDAGLNWNDFLPKNEDVNKFVTEQVSFMMFSPFSSLPYCW